MDTLLSPSLESTLSMILTQLANFFGTTTDIVAENLPIWLAKYGWFMCITNIGWSLIVGLFLGGVISFLIAFIINCMLEKELGSREFKWIIVIVILSGVISCGISIVSCAIAPEFYALSVIMNLLSK